MGDEVEKLEAFLTNIFKDREPTVLLEAGCGSISHFNIGNVKKIVGIDISRERLERNPFIQEKMVGDLQTYPLPEDTFDIIVCFNVIEHIANPQLVMENFFRALRSKGCIVLGFPNLVSLKGLITKFTPYFVHEYFYRYVFGDRRKEDFEQFPTYLRLFIEPGRLKRFVESRGFPVSYFVLYEGPVQESWRRQSGIMNALFALLGAASRLLTLNRVDLNLTDCLIVIEKP